MSVAIVLAVQQPDYRLDELFLIQPLKLEALELVFAFVIDITSTHVQNVLLDVCAVNASDEPEHEIGDRRRSNMPESIRDELFLLEKFEHLDDCDLVVVPILEWESGT